MKRLVVLFAVAVLACTPTTPDGRGQSPSGTAAEAQRSPLSRITKLVVDKVESPTFEGRAFGEVGQYEKLTGRAFGVADPKDPVDATIVNIERAPRNAQGLVEYDVDFYILKPIDMTKGNKSLFYDVVNRGNKNLHTTFNVGAGGGNNPTKAADAGDGLLMNMGYTLVWSVWQGDVLPGGDRQTVRFPIATASSGGPITKKIWTEFVFDTPSTYTVPVSWDRGPDVKPYPAVESAMSQAALSRRKGTDGESQPIARSDWSFGKCADGKAVTPTNVDVCYPAGFTGDWVYDLVYEARDPMVMGLGFAATRDIMSFLRFDTSDGNPLVTKSSNKNPIEWALGFGSSQSGRFLKDLIYQGFNQDTNGRKVSDGTNPLQYRETQRALMADLFQWVTKETAPPPSRFPSLAKGELVPSLPQSGQGFPAIPGVTFSGRVNHLSVIDYSQLPARHVPGQDYHVLVPKVDADGNDMAGVRSANLLAPIGTYTGWNLRAKGFMEGEGCYLNGSYVPFAQTKAQRSAANDPRPSLEERYGTRQKYVDTISTAARQLVADRLMLQQDAERIIGAAATTDLGTAVK